MVTLERKTGIVTAEGPAGGSWDAGNVLFWAWMAGTGMLFYNNSLSGIYIYVMQLLSVFCLTELCGIAIIQPFFNLQNDNFIWFNLVSHNKKYAPIPNDDREDY